MQIVLDGLHLVRGSFRLSADLVVEAGHKVALIGPSGGGKSSLLSAIAGFGEVEAGRILIGDRDMVGLPPVEHPVTLLFQDHNLFPHLTVGQNIGLGIRPNLRLTGEERDRLASALDEVGLAGMEARMPSQLSGGQHSRVALARALLRHKPVLLLDEPFSALGPALRAEMLDLVARIHSEKGATLLMVTHAPEDAARLCDQIILVDQNRALPPEDAARMLANPSERLAKYLG